MKIKTCKTWLIAFSCSLLLLGLLGSCSSSPAKASSGKAGGGKQIILRADPFPNYAFHLYSIAEINGRDSGYRAKYAGTLGFDDNEILRRYRELLTFSDGGGGPLAAVFCVIPMYIRPETPEEVRNYYEVVVRCVNNESFSELLEHYGEYFSRMNDMGGMDSNVAAQMMSQLTDYKDPVREMADVFIRNYQPFLETVWPAEREILNAQIAALQGRIHRENFIEKWEKLTGMVFKYDVYEIEMCTSLENVSNAVSPGYERNSFYYDGDEERFVTFISHETGTHILDMSNTMYPLLNDYDGSLVYKAYETLALYYNQRIAGTLNFGPYYDQERFFAIYENIEKKNPLIGPFDLLKEGIKEYTEKI